MWQAFSHLRLRKLRTTLTVLGISIGIITLTVMGAMSERLNHIIDGAFQYYNTRIIVQPQSSFPGGILGPPLAKDIVQSINKIPGVKRAFPTVIVLYLEQPGEAISHYLGIPPIIKGIEVERLHYKGEMLPLELQSGRLINFNESKVAIVGFDIANRLQLTAGNTLILNEIAYHIVGVMSQTMTIRDNFIFIPIEEAQSLLSRLLPYPLNQNPESLISEVEVYPTILEDADTIARTIEEQISGVQALPPGKIKALYEQKLAIFLAIAISSSIIAVIIGALSILNTMMMAVSERTREIGIKKVLGASNADIMKEFIFESILIGIIGGATGLLIGQIIITLLSRKMLQSGITLFTITPRLIILIFLFAVVLGVLAGLLPALIASRRKPIETLRAE